MSFGGMSLKLNYIVNGSREYGLPNNLGIAWAASGLSVLEC